MLQLATEHGPLKFRDFFHRHVSLPEGEISMVVPMVSSLDETKALETTLDQQPGVKLNLDWLKVHGLRVDICPHRFIGKGTYTTLWI